MTVTFNRVANGEFEVLLNGKPTQYSIFNSSQGIDGNGRNVYGIFNSETGKYTFPGTLQKAKKMVAFSLSKV